ncbi:MAG: FAD-dependent oxidoreductase [Hyphomicrobiaceae bacterium]
MIGAIADIGADDTYDVIVAGAGAAGLSAALFAAIAGRRALVVERTEYVGGTTALSAGSTWLPSTQHATTVAGGAEDSLENAERFLASVVANHSSAAMRRAFLEAGARAVATLERESEVHFRAYPTHPDYEQEHEGATLRGRALEPLPFDGRVLGRHLALVRPPIPEFLLLGGMMVDRTDIGHLLKIGRSVASTKHAARILICYGLDRLTGSRRGSRLVMGNALVGRLLKSLIDRNVDIVTRATVATITRDASGVTGLVVEGGGMRRTLLARRAVVLAGGGFSRHPKRRAAMLGEPAPPYSPSAPGHTGELQDLALALGARFGEGAADNAYWAPCSVRQRADGSTAVFPHFVLDRSKPGTVCIDGTGRRFVNEATSYHLFARAMRDAAPERPAVPCYIVTDSEGLRKYGLGMVRMGTRDLSPFLADGYLVRGTTVRELADKLAIPADALADTVARMNEFARNGHDPDFGRGKTAYHRVNGDASSRGPNPTLGQIAAPPFYAVRLWPGDIGAATGLAVDTDARVLGADGRPIPRLYACGNEAQSVMGGVYPAPGITLGPAIAFAWRAMQDALDRND